MEIVRAFIIGVITIGVLTAVLAPGRQTVNVIKATSSGATSLLQTAERG